MHLISVNSSVGGNIFFFLP